MMKYIYGNISMPILQRQIRVICPISIKKIPKHFEGVRYSHEFFTNREKN